ncbi:hypothetical protein ACLMJK_009167 [Lecanora helva]
MLNAITGDPTEEMKYINSLMQKFMPQQSSIAVNSTPKLHGIFDTINATMAASHPDLRLPKELNDRRAYAIMNRILMAEEYSGYAENRECRRLGIGALLGEIVQTMERRIWQGKNNDGDGDGNDASSNGPRLALYAAHDSTLAAILTSLGVWGSGQGHWPPYTSSLALELFKLRESQGSDDESKHFVRLRYNDRSLILPGCRLKGLYLSGREDFCTLVRDDCLFGDLKGDLLACCRLDSGKSLANLRQGIGRENV